MKAQASFTVSITSGQYGLARSTAAVPQNGSTYVSGLPSRCHTSDATVAFPPQYGQGACNAILLFPIFQPVTQGDQIIKSLFGCWIKRSRTDYCVLLHCTTQGLNSGLNKRDRRAYPCICQSLALGRGIDHDKKRNATEGKRKDQTKNPTIDIHLASPC